MNLIINRRKWLRGKPHESYLLHATNNKMCCLGFLAKQCGYSDDEICGVTSPAGLKYRMFIEAMENKFPKTILNKDFENTDITGILMDINDKKRKNFTLAKREKKIKELFKKAGIKVKFIN